MKVVALAGGTGSAKLLRGMQKLGVDLTVGANVGDNFRAYGVYVCPDIDISVYALAGVSDESQGWGIAGDSFRVLEGLSRLGLETWFKLGDRDLATCLLRTKAMGGGATLTEATRGICRALGVQTRVLPVSDRHFETHIVTVRGELHLQEFWVRERGSPRVTGVRYAGARGARTTKEVVGAISEADRVFVCPANPVTSIGPMLAVPRFRQLLAGSRGRIVALSPMTGSAPFSGPAGKLMKATGVRTDSVGVAELYRGFLDAIMISESDRRMRPEIEGLGVHCATTDTRMDGPEDETRLAKEMLQV